MQGKARLAGRVGGDLAKSALLPVESVQVLLAVALLARRTGLHYFAWKLIHYHFSRIYTLVPSRISFCKTCPRKVFQDFLVENVVLVHVMPTYHIPILDH